MGKWPGSRVPEANTHLWGDARPATANRRQEATLPGTGSHQMSWFLMGSGQGLPTHYPHSLAAYPSCGPAELGPGTPTPLETGTQPRPPRSPAPTRTQPTHITVVHPAHLPPLLPSRHFHSPTPKLGSQTWQDPALWEDTVATVLCPIAAGPETVWTDSLCGAARSTVGSATGAHAPQRNELACPT